ncbi:bifunctional demethylmenaquinone methyltransferase/2-methoxy-6-polyprenyl-1,4-benzoquinol methylase UbiE [Glaciihabitans sp. GrIS 2.15]|uniref:bifunctional demethylmenaquinone methyltransferase/2-methoxy-6-polyprenyl-1,4-benzoquinol methylase UbiE n=1 Tax=Glaciihabitans sp. GrIS 2.15 TaxID=3071710 RepID=UPI002E0952C1|nr:demethylmenaquinone methyltransferase/2-methoxy-6-polyprenyl-1,4-benzoquinol methylase [Glaciihabitans sp. GrIS 2.15]
MAKADLTKQPKEVAEMFDDVAKHYDRTNDVLSMGNSFIWRIATTRAVAAVAGERILDIAAGTGTSSAALAKSGADVVAADFSPGMIEVGRQKHPSISFVVADATDLPFADGEFDAVTASFGLRNVENPKKALAEMYRVLKPGGRLVICEFSTPSRAIFRAGYTAYMRYLMPSIVGVASSNPEAYTYLADSIREWPDQVTLSQWIRGAGFTRVAYRNLTTGVVALHRGHKPARVVTRRASRKTVSTKKPEIETVTDLGATNTDVSGTNPDSPAAPKP